MLNFLYQIRRLVFSKTVKNTSVLFAGNAVSSIVAIVFTIVAARVLGPENYGLIAAVGSVLGISVAFGELGLDASLLKFVSRLWKKKRYKEANKIFEVVFTFRVATAVLFSVALIVLSPILTKIIFKTDDIRIMMLTVLGLFGALLIDFQIAANQAKQKWKEAAITLSLINVIRLLLLFVVVYLNMVNLISILLVYTSAALIGYFVSLTWHRTYPALTHDWKKIVGQVAPFSKWMGGNKMVSSVNSRIDVLLLVQYASAFDTGIYAAANRLAMGVPVIIGSFATVLAPKFASFDKKEDSKVYFKKTFGLSMIIVAGMVLGIVVAPLVVGLFGEDYVRSTSVLQWLFVAFIPFALSVPAVNALIYLFKRPEILTINSASQMPIIFIANFVLIPKIGVYSPVLVIGLINIMTLIVTYYFLAKEYKK